MILGRRMNNGFEKTEYFIWDPILKRDKVVALNLKHPTWQLLSPVPSQYNFVVQSLKATILFFSLGLFKFLSRA